MKRIKIPALFAMTDSRLNQLRYIFTIENSMKLIGN